MYDAVILGAGISGLMAVEELAVQKGLKVALVDCLPDPGGNHRSINIDGFTFDVGAFVFWRNNPFFKRFPGVLARGVAIDLLQERICPDGKVRRYPIDVDAELFGRTWLYPLQVALDVIRSRIAIRRCRNAEEYSVYYLGRRLYVDSGLKTYLTRFCGLEGPKIDVEFAVKRMQWIRHATSLRRLALRGMERLKRPMSSRRAIRKPETPFVRSAAGFPDMYAPAIEKLRSAGVEVSLGASLTRIAREDAGFFVVETSGGALRCARVINTMPLEVVLPLVKSTITPPTSLQLYSLFLSFRGRRRFDAQILFNFHIEGKWKRVTMHSDYYGTRDDREYLTVEFLWPGASAPTADVLFADFRTHLRSLGFFEGELTVEGMAQTDYAYPLYVTENIRRRDAAISALESAGIETFGRQGRYDYLPSVAVAADAVLKRLKA